MLISTHWGRKHLCPAADASVRGGLGARGRVEGGRLAWLAGWLGWLAGLGWAGWLAGLGWLHGCVNMTK